LRALGRLPVLAAALGVLGAVVTAGLVLGLASEPGNDPPATGVPAPARAGPGTLAVARRSGDVLVGLVARPGGPAELRIFDGTGGPLADGIVRAAVDARERPGARCGPGCLRLAVPVLEGSAADLAVSVERPGKPRRDVLFRLPARLPPSGAPELAAAKRAMRALGSVRIAEHLSTGAASLSSWWTMAAPDRLRVSGSDGSRSVVIGARRWDRSRGDAWVESEAEPLRLPDFQWLEARHARIIGKTVRDGVTLLLVGAADLERSWWFVLAVRPDGLVVESRMLAPAHFMVDRYSGFDAPVTIEPPASQMPARAPAGGRRQP
jgi:hypothetical protein